MDKFIVFRSVLIYLLLCYGKKFVDANERNKKESISHQNLNPTQTRQNLINESFPNSQNINSQPTSRNINEQNEFVEKIEIDLNPKKTNEPVNLIILNIDIKESTNEVIYERKQDGSHHFICRDNYLIKEVRREGKISWRPTNNNYASGMIFIENLNGSPWLKALIPDDKTQKQNPHLEQTNYKVHQQQPRINIPNSNINLNDIFVVDPNGDSDSDNSQQNYAQSQQNYHSTRQGQVSYVSEHFGVDSDSSDVEYIHHVPKRRSNSEYSNQSSEYQDKRYVEIPIKGSQNNERQNYYENQYNQQKRRTKIPHPKKHGHVTSNVKNIIVLDVSIQDNDGYEVIDNGHKVTFVAKETFLFNKVKNRNKIVWEPKNPNDYAEKVIVKIDKYNKLNYDIVIHEEEINDDEEDEYEHYEEPIQINRKQQSSHSNYTQKPIEMNKESEIYVPDVNILTINQQNVLKVNDLSQYSLSKHESILKYQFKQEAKCVEVKYINETVWKAETHCPISVSFNRQEKTFIIDFGTAYILCKKQENKWLNVIHKYGVNNEEMGIKYNVAKPRDVVEETTSKQNISMFAHKTTAIIDIDARQPMNEFDFSKNSNECGTYVPKHNLIFKVVKGSTTKTNCLAGKKVEIWHPDNEEEYVTKVIIDGVNKTNKVNNATLFLANGNVKHFTIIEKNWVEVSPSVMLNVEVKHDTCEYNYYNDNGIHTYIPKGQFLFQGIKQTIGGMCAKTDVDIWETNNPNEYGTKAMMITTKQKENYIIMFLIDDTFKLFYQSGKGSMWRDESTNASTICNLKLLGVDVADKSNYGIVSIKKNKGSYKNIKTEPSNIIDSDPRKINEHNQIVRDGNINDDLLGGNRIDTDRNLQNLRRQTGNEIQTKRKIVVQHVECDPNKIYDSEESEMTNQYTESSNSEYSENEEHGSRSKWIRM